MRKKSKLIEQLKAEEMLQYKNLSPGQRVEVAISHNKLIKEIFFAGMRKKGFSKEEIVRKYHGHLDE
ncbi:MAG: hypothetical protein KAW12_14525 [Candidatus Aminicenantes bacterium]|nr:hypothetical protein [Candidatus Aminicenantes bacterium]